MKAANFLNLLLAVALVLLCAKLHLTPSASAPDAAQAANIAPGTEWRDVSPKEAVMDPAAVGLRDTMLLASGREGDFNAMTIGWWGTGVLWKKPVVSVYVSGSRHTWGFMETNETFTVCAFPDGNESALMYMGRHSGRDGDKVGPSGLTAAFTDAGNPYFREAQLVLECRRIYKAPLDDHAQLPDDARRLYDNGMLPHTMYVGEIVAVHTRLPAR